MGNNYLGLDVGDRRVGVAVARADVRMAQPRGAIDRLEEDIWEALERIIHDNEIATVVVGLPRGLDGQETAQTTITRQFVTDFEAKFQLKVHLQDEAGTSRQAEQELKSRKVSYTKGDIDALAATIILTDYLNDNGER